MLGRVVVFTMKMEPVKRPSNKEDDEELLALQNKFIKEVSQPSAKVIKVQKKGNDANSISVEKSHSDDENHCIIGDIVERNANLSTVPSAPCASKFSFPESSKTELKDSTTNSCKFGGKSLFVQQRLKKHETSPLVFDQTGSSKFHEKKLHDIDTEEISHENEKKLSEMTTEEILYEQKKISETLDPKLLDFIKSRKKPKDSTHHQQMAISLTNDSTHAIEDTKSVNSDVESQTSMDVDKSSTKRVHFEGVEEIKDASTSTDQVINCSDILRGKWLNMKTFEGEKLRWTSNVNIDAKINQSTKVTARFDFDGKLVDDSKVIDTKKGLHHHGEEPERAGYSVDEIFMLVRSTVISQRVFGLQLLGNLLNKIGTGLFDGCFSPPLLQLMLDGGLVPLIRFALDDSTDTTVGAAIYTLRCLLYSTEDEFWLDSTFCWHRGYLRPLLDKLHHTSNKELSDMTDEQLLNMDVIKALYRMDLLDRLSYIIGKFHIDDVIADNIVQTLISLSRHSEDLVMAILKSKSLMVFLLSKLKPHNYHTSKSSEKEIDTLEQLMFDCVKIIRVMASCSRQAASSLVCDYKVMESVMSFLAVDQSLFSSQSSSRYFQLRIESLRLWRVLLTYGFNSNYYLDLYPVIMKQFHLLTSLDVNSDINQFDFYYGANLISVLEAILIVALNSTDSSSQDSAISSVNFSHVHGLLSPLETCVKKWFSQISTDEYLKINDYAMLMMSKCLDLYGLFCRSHHYDIETVDYINKFVESVTFTYLMKKVRSYSMFLTNDDCGLINGPSNLPNNSRIFGTADVARIFHRGSPYPLLTSAFSFVYTFTSTQTTESSTKMVEYLFQHVEVNSYLLKLRKNKSLPVYWCQKYEIYLIFYLGKLSLLIENNRYLFEVYHDVALLLLNRLQNGDRMMAVTLLRHFLFNDKYLRIDFLKEKMEELRLTDTDEHRLSTFPSDTLQNCISNLDKIKESYARLLLGQNMNDDNRCDENELSPCNIDSLCVLDANQTIFPVDWFYLPLVSVYTRFTSICKTERSETLSHSDTLQVVHCLQWLLLICYRQPSSLKAMTLPIHYCRLACVFLSGNDAFMNVNVRETLKPLLELLVKYGVDETYSFGEDIPGIPSFVSFYEDLIHQYEAVSYADQLFASFLVVPLQQTCDVKLKKCLWSQHADVIRMITLDDNNSLIPLKYFLHPLEADDEMLQCYFSALASGLATHNSSPFMYTIAVHHLHHFLKSCDSPDDVDPTERQLRQCIQSFVKQSQNTILTEHLIHNYSSNR